MACELILAYDRPREVAALFAEYTAMLIRGDEEMRGYLAQQNYDEEVLHLAEKYGPPGGRLYLALEDGQAVGCIALHRLDERRCELKRLYVLPACRGRGIARRLAGQVVADARTIGYEAMYLDTLPFLREAMALYRSMGFVEIEKYNDSPMTHSHFFRLAL